jgi:hypothetical protein
MIVTIRDIQPRQSSESTEKSSDDIVYELAETILGKLVKYIDIHECLPSLLWVNKFFTYYINNFNLKVIIPFVQYKSVNFIREHCSQHNYLLYIKIYGYMFQLYTKVFVRLNVEILKYTKIFILFFLTTHERMTQIKIAV